MAVHGLIDAEPIEKHASLAAAAVRPGPVVRPGGITVPGVRALQRAAGNAATRRMLQRCGAGGCTCGGTCGGAGGHPALRSGTTDAVGEPEAAAIARRLAGAVAARSVRTGTGR